MAEGISQQSIMESYQTEADILKKQQQEMLKKQEEALKAQQEAVTAPTELEARFAAREISPEARAREKAVIAEMFGMPSDVEARMREAGVAPTAAGAIISDRMNQYLTQLDSLRDSRKARRSRVDDVIKDLTAAVEARALGKEAEARLAQTALSAQESLVNLKWREYSEAVRQQEFAIVQARLNAQAAALSKMQKQIMLQDKVNDYFGNVVRPGKEDGMYSVKDYLAAREFSRKGGIMDGIEYEGLGDYDWFDKARPVESMINLANPANVSQLAEAGIDASSMILNWDKDRKVGEFGKIIQRSAISNDPGLMVGTAQLYKNSGVNMMDISDEKGVAGQISDMIKEYDRIYGTKVHGSIWPK